MAPPGRLRRALRPGLDARDDADVRLGYVVRDCPGSAPRSGCTSSYLLCTAIRRDFHYLPPFLGSSPR